SLAHHLRALEVEPLALQADPQRLVQLRVGPEELERAAQVALGRGAPALLEVDAGVPQPGQPVRRDRDRPLVLGPGLVEPPRRPRGGGRRVGCGCAPPAGPPPPPPPRASARCAPRGARKPSGTPGEGRRPAPPRGRRGGRGGRATPRPPAA